VAASGKGGPATRQIDGIALVLGVAGLATSNRFYVDRGFVVATQAAVGGPTETCRR
jgi:hypothetical protein